MSEAVAGCLALTRQVLEARKRSLEPIEETLLHELDTAWGGMTQEEQAETDNAIKRLVF